MGQDLTQAGQGWRRKHTWPRISQWPSASDIRKIALALDGTSEIDHFAYRPAFRETRKRIFAVMRPDGLYLHLPPMSGRHFCSRPILKRSSNICGARPQT